jgi:long-chain fatty acid transport protein
MRSSLLSSVLVGLLALGYPVLSYAQGLVVPGAGAMHQSMGGASTAQGADALGAMYWNPAAMSLMPRSEVVLGGSAILANLKLGSTIPAGTFGPFPLETLSGETRSDSGVSLLSGLAFVYKPECSPFTYGMAIVSLAGGGVNYPGDPLNPILAPTGPFNRFVLGPQAGSLLIASMMPTVSYQVTEALAVGGGPMLDVAAVSFDPAFFGPPDDANGDGLFTFPSGSHSQPFWGGGFRLGAVYQMMECLALGFSFTSPQWFQTWTFNAKNEVGDPISFSTQFSLPTVLSAGVSYTGIENLMLNADVRWFDYATTKLLGTAPQDGGAGWKSIWAIALGARYQVSEQLSVQAGYIWNQNPISSNLTLFNTMLPLITQNTLSLGGYFQVNDALGMSLAWIHGFENSVSGGVFPLVGTSVSLKTDYDALVFGIHIKFGGSACTPIYAPASASLASPAG